MVEEMSAFQSSGIWGIAPLFLGKSIVGYCGLLQLKCLDGEVDGLKAQLVAKCST